MSPDLSEIWNELFLEVGAFPLLGSEIKPLCALHVAVDFGAGASRMIAVSFRSF